MRWVHLCLLCYKCMAYACRDLLPSLKIRAPKIVLPLHGSGAWHSFGLLSWGRTQTPFRLDSSHLSLARAVSLVSFPIVVSSHSSLLHFWPSKFDIKVLISGLVCIGDWWRWMEQTEHIKYHLYKVLISNSLRQSWTSWCKQLMLQFKLQSLQTRWLVWCMLVLHLVPLVHWKVLQKICINLSRSRCTS